ncbi:hypothetical protein BDU57DRAFT_564539 [Ampelomyces quisqualis]|uniref:Uncharacterized protein n=1 Tax=Ampelomyces quisqualis TaxID=50730 RepID=A0A6A5QBS9_AMPQU|nr:hypothetical protein BDU57DRAFT_564539 [Ampelomyces quisqualis]
MAASQTMQTSQLTIPGAGTPTLRKIGQTWCIYNVATAIPYDLHPQQEHRANHWSSKFQEALKDVSQVVKLEELEEFQEKCESIVEIRCNKKPKRVKYLITEDLKSVERVFRHKRAAEVENENKRMEREAAQRTRSSHPA